MAREKSSGTVEKKPRAPRPPASPEPPAAALSEAAWRRLAREAERARRRAYAPYSRYAVGAALLTSEGVVRGCNVENAAYPLCICAEASAVSRAIGEGWRVWHAIAVATPGPEAGAPCGACRQILAEFAPTLPVALVADGEIQRLTTVAELLPLGFSGAVLDRATGRRISSP